MQSWSSIAHAEGAAELVHAHPGAALQLRRTWAPGCCSSRDSKPAKTVVPRCASSLPCSRGSTAEAALVRVYSMSTILRCLRGQPTVRWLRRERAVRHGSPGNCSSVRPLSVSSCSPGSRWARAGSRFGPSFAAEMCSAVRPAMPQISAGHGLCEHGHGHNDQEACQQPRHSAGQAAAQVGVYSRARSACAHLGC